MAGALHGPLVKWFKTIPSHGINRGSNPLRVTNRIIAVILTPLISRIVVEIWSDDHSKCEIRQSLKQTLTNPIFKAEICLTLF
jgi:hypothetical protein